MFGRSRQTPLCLLPLLGPSQDKVLLLLAKHNTLGLINLRKFKKSYVSRAVRHTSRQLEAIFREVFFNYYNTVLVGGAAEPVYWPAGHDSGDGACGLNRLCYRADYFASALHETAHWCIAGPARRCCVDFGYWYAPDGRNVEQQRAFQRVEVRPQALEWLFSVASGYRFRVSLDNLNGLENAGDNDFAVAVREQALHWCDTSPPERAVKFISALATYYGIPDPCNPEHFQELPL